MVKALHKAGIEVILDVVFNHTGEGNHEGPTISFRGLDNERLLPPRALRQAVLHEPLGLREHVQLQPPAGREVHRRVPAVLGPRDARRRLPLRPRLDPVARPGRQPDGRSAGPLAHRARRRAGRHQDHRRGLGRRRPLPGRLLPGLPLGRVERPLPRRHPALRQGRQGARRRRSRRGSPAAPTSTRPTASCRSTASTSSPPTTASRSTTWSRTTASTTRPTARATATATDDNLSWNYGVEGETDDPEIEALRARQVRNFLTILMLSQGVPMMVMGDEARQTQFGNNNAYCQDNEITWFDWDARRRARRPDPLHQRADRLPQGATRRSGARATSPASVNERGLADISWHGCRHLLARLGRPRTRGSSPSPWPASRRRATGKSTRHRHPRHDEHGLVRTSTSTSRRSTAGAGTGPSTRAPAAPDDIHAKGHEPLCEGDTYTVKNRSIVVLISKP